MNAKPLKTILLVFSLAAAQFGCAIQAQKQEQPQPAMQETVDGEAYQACVDRADDMADAYLDLQSQKLASIRNGSSAEAQQMRENILIGFQEYAARECEKNPDKKFTLLLDGNQGTVTAPSTPATQSKASKLWKPSNSKLQ